MTADELIEILQKYPPSTPVVLDGYEGAVDDVAEVHRIHIALHAHEDIYKTGIWGLHEEAYLKDGVWCYYNRDSTATHEIVEAIYLPRRDMIEDDKNCLG